MEELREMVISDFSVIQFLGLAIAPHTEAWEMVISDFSDI